MLQLLSLSREAPERPFPLPSAEDLPVCRHLHSWCDRESFWRTCVTSGNPDVSSRLVCYVNIIVIAYLCARDHIHLPCKDHASRYPIQVSYRFHTVAASCPGFISAGILRPQTDLVLVTLSHHSLSRCQILLSASHQTCWHAHAGPMT